MHHIAFFEKMEVVFSWFFPRRNKSSPIAHFFAKSQKGRYVKRHFDSMLQTLQESGKLSELYQKYGRVTLSNEPQRNAGSERLTP